ncbi:MAG: PTS transporter subunit EIIA [Gammaproteobacteria bacterium]|nr:PTS transporter subunit EIIA [Gammaproteobacteria bacterium]
MPGKLINRILPDDPDAGQPAEDASDYSLADLLAPGRVACNVTARGKKHCLEIVSRLLTNNSESLTYSEVFDTIYQRERLGSTSLGEGFALPHGRVADLDHSIGAFLMLTSPIDFDLDGEGEVDMVFALAVPAESDEAHLKDLSEIAKILSRTNIREHVGGITSSVALYEALLELSRETANNDSQPDA